ncbi:MAG TPA: VWA domain-containing protein [Stellaceae bacterium]|nr:VWA domain-containing protein [Stellaceae bacterium]
MEGTSQPHLPDEGGRLLENIMYFARCLRAAGLRIGPGKVLAAVEAVRAVGLEDRNDFYWALHAVFVNRHDQEELFDQAFHIFWRNPKLLERMLGMMLPEIEAPAPEKGEEMNRRLAEALKPPGQGDGKDEDEVELDAAMTFSDREVFHTMDFEKMSGAEITAAKAAIARMALPLADVMTRRFWPDPRGTRTDMRASFRAQLRSSAMIALKRKSPKRQPPPLVIICDISGSMSRYSRLFIHFMHAVTNDRDRVYTFLFGTRLTNITRYLRYKDIDVALDKVAGAVEDWSGGTRIGEALGDFNRNWSRRVLGQGAIVLLITDGLDRDAGAGIGAEMDRLHRSCRRLIWLNPLLRYEGFAPKSLGMKAILPHVDEFRPIHSLESLGELVAALSRPSARRLEAAAAWRETG